MKKEPWVVVFEPKWPFSFHIACGEERLVEFRRVAHSTKADTLEDVRLAVGFSSHERPNVVAVVAEQEALAQSICDAMNSQESLRSDLAAMREALAWARPYVTGAYECAFPDEDQNREVLTAIDEALAKGGQP